MAVLPATDLGIMNEHLSTHEGLIHKLNWYRQLTTAPHLRDSITLQRNVMEIHAKIMLAFINPYHNNDDIDVPSIDTVKASTNTQPTIYNYANNDKWISQELHGTAKLMSTNNYTSALMMKDSHVRNAHIKMALQQLEFQKRYEDFITKMGWSFVPHGSIDDQVNTYYHFQHLLH